MPSYCSRESAEAKGRVTSVGVDRAGAALDDGSNRDLRSALVFAGGAGHAHDIAQADGVGIAALEDKDAVGSGRVAVANRVLDEEAA